jgi:ATP-dependent Clp protease adaptor protein ClpS
MPDVLDAVRTEEAVSTEEERRVEEDLRLGAPWQTVVWDDPVNLMTYVTWVFRTHFGFAKQKAEQLMLQVHTEGSAVVATGSREEMERHVEAMHGYGLLATLRPVPPS